MSLGSTSNNIIKRFINYGVITNFKMRNLTNKVCSNLLSGYYLIKGTLMECNIDYTHILENNNKRLNVTAHLKLIKQVESYCKSYHSSFPMVYKSLKKAVN